MKAQEETFQLREIMLFFILLCIGVSLRMIEITRPFIGEWSWRQADVAMIAENFYRNGFNIFYPQINWAGNSPGYVGTEFPLVPFLASLLYPVFGVHEWIGRSVSIFFFALSVPFFYLLVRALFNQRSALFAVAIYDLTPLGIFAGRSFMPDMTSLSLSIIAIYIFALYLERPEPRSKLLIMAAAATSLAILVKVPAIIIGLPLGYMAWQAYGVRLVLKKQLWLFAIFSLIFPTAWYFHAYLISVMYSPHHMFGSRSLGLETLDGYGTILGQAMTSSLTPVVFLAMLLGLLLPAENKFGRIFHWWSLAILLFAFVAASGHSRHPWYLLPLVPVAAALTGRACDFVLSKVTEPARSKKIAALVLVFFFALSYFSFAYTMPLYRPWGMRSFKAGLELNRIAPPHALAVVADGGDPTCLYYSRRKGWHFLDDFGSTPANSEQAILALEQLRKRGATHLIFTRYTVWWLDYFKAFHSYIDSHYRPVRRTEEYIIFDLEGLRSKNKLPAIRDANSEVGKKS